VVSVQTDTGSGPHPRQKSPHAHGIAVDPTGLYALVADLGADRIFTYRVDPATRQLTPGDPPFVATAPGAGPRHLAFSPNGKFVYANTELSSQILTFRWNAAAGKLEPLAATSTLSAGYRGANGAGELAFSRDGKYLYASNRGEDTLVVYRANAATGAIEEIQRLASGGKSPWNFAIDYSGRWFLVANEGSDAISVFKRDPASGKLSPTRETLASPQPSSVVFLTH
jgi:6-phosphogluconolactonase